MTTDNLGAFYSGNISSANGTQLVLPIAPDTCGAGCVLISTQCCKWCNGGRVSSQSQPPLLSE